MITHHLEDIMNNEQFLALYDEIKNIRINVVHQMSRLSTIEKIIMEVIKETTPNIPAEEIKKEESE
jgi:hypothetical protein